jgi:hypothetical protein
LEVERKRVKWCEVLWCGAMKRDICEVILFGSEAKGSEVSYVEVLRDKTTLNIRVPFTAVTWWYFDYFIWCVFCTVVVLTCFVICGCVYVWVL